MTTEIVNTVTGEIVPADNTRAHMIRPDTDNWMAVYDGNAKDLALDLCKTEFVPKGLRGNPAATLGVILFGREVGMSPIAAMQGLYAVDGRVGLYSETMRAMVLAAGHEYRITANDSSRCVIEGRRNGAEDWQKFTFTLQEARDAGLAGKDNWKKYAPDMLLARATARMCRAIFPDTIRGFSAAEELQDMASSSVTTVTQVDVPAEPAPARVTRKRSAAAAPAGPEPERQSIGLAPKPAAAPPAIDQDGDSEDGGVASSAQVAAIVQHLGSRLGVTDRDDRLYWTAVAAELDNPASLGSTKDLTYEQAALALNHLGKVKNRQGLDALVGQPIIEQQ